jgi:hypothetical protein
MPDSIPIPSRGWTNRFVLRHLYTRCLGLDLWLDGEDAPPFSDWEALLSRSAAGPSVREAAGEPAAALDRSPRAALSGRHPALIRELMRGLGVRIEAGEAQRRRLPL